MKNEGCDIFQSSTAKSMNLLKLSGLEMLIKGEGQIYKEIYIYVYAYVDRCVYFMGQASISGIAIFFIGVTGN